MFPEITSIGIRRKKLGLSQNGFAKMAGISQSMLTKIEHGTTMPSYKKAIELFNTLDELEHREEKTAKDLMKKGVITLQADDTIDKASKLAKKNGVSQFIVLDHGKIVGGVKTTNLIDVPKSAKIRPQLEPPFPTINENAPASIIKELLKHEQAVIVIRNGDIVGIITAEDFL